MLLKKSLKFLIKGEGFKYLEYGQVALRKVSTAIRAALGNATKSTVIEEGNSITILRLSPCGPDLTVLWTECGIVLSIGPWHGDVGSPEVANSYIARALTGSLRVRIDKLNGKPWKFAIELQDDRGNWQPEDEIVFFRFRFPGRNTLSTTYMQNVPADCYAKPMMALP